jgi:hypothetical protein
MQDKNKILRENFVKYLQENLQSKHFSLKVKGDKDKKIENKIIKFRIIASANDGKCNRYTIQSDKDYFLGFRKK